MIILKESAVTQVVKFIPTRLATANKLFLRNESTNVEVEYSITCTAESFYLKFSKIVNLEEGHFYTMTIKNNTDLVYLDKVFCTNQDIDTYSVNKDEYVAHNQNIIFYE
jgi:hypothetical protein